jgi:hypothetical protein
MGEVVLLLLFLGAVVALIVVVGIIWINIYLKRIEGHLRGMAARR